MNIERIFKNNPPQQRLDSLRAIVADWRWRFGERGFLKLRRDQVVEFCRTAMSLQDAIVRACASRDATGRMHNHQSRVKEVDRQKFARRIVRTLVRDLPSSFDDLYDRLTELAPSGIGPVTVYDVSTRIAAFLRLEIESLYLHAGVRQGWCRLHGLKTTQINRVPREQWPLELRLLPADEVEDLLCTYRQVLPRIA